VTGRAVPVRRSAENGGPAGSDTRTGPWLAASRRASGDPAEGSRSGLPSRVDRTGTGPAAAWPPGALATLTVAVAARASAVRASSGSEGPGSTSKSMPLIKLGKPYLSQRLDIRREPGHSGRSRARAGVLRVGARVLSGRAAGEGDRADAADVQLGGIRHRAGAPVGKPRGKQRRERRLVVRFKLVGEPRRQPGEPGARVLGGARVRRRVEVDRELPFVDDVPAGLGQPRRPVRAERRQLLGVRAAERRKHAILETGPAEAKVRPQKAQRLRELRDRDQAARAGRG